MIQEIRRVCPQLERVAVRDVDILGEGRVYVEEAGSAEKITSGITEVAWRRRREQCPLGGVEIELQTGGGIVEYLSQTASATGAVCRCLADARHGIRTGIDRKRPARFEFQETGNGPSSGDLIEQRSTLPPKQAGSPEW